MNQSNQSAGKLVLASWPPNALRRWGMFSHPQGSIVTNCLARVALCRSMLNWRRPDSPASGAYGNDDPEAAWDS